MDNNIAQPKKSKLPIIILIIILVIGICIGGILISKKIFNNNSSTKENLSNTEQKEENKAKTKSEVIEVDKEKANEKLDLLNLFIQIANEQERLSKGSNYYYFDNLKNGDEVLNSAEKKMDFVYAYTVQFCEEVLADEELERLTDAYGTGSRAVPVSELIKAYKNLFGNELGNYTQYPSTRSDTGKVVEGYVLGSFWTGWSDLGTKLTFNSLTKMGDEYTLTVDISYFDENSRDYKSSNDKLILKLTKVNDEVYTINSMTINKQ